MVIGHPDNPDSRFDDDEIDINDELDDMIRLAAFDPETVISDSDFCETDMFGEMLRIVAKCSLKPCYTKTSDPMLELVRIMNRYFAEAILDEK